MPLRKSTGWTATITRTGPVGKIDWAALSARMILSTSAASAPSFYRTAIGPASISMIGTAPACFGLVSGGKGPAASTVAKAGPPVRTREPLAGGFPPSVDL